MIHVENLVKSYGELKAVAGVSLEVASGELRGTMGEAGARFLLRRL